LVVCDDAGPREVVDDSVTGFRVAPGDSFGFAEVHRKLLDDPRLRSKMGRAARRKVEQKFTWDRYTDIIEKHLSEACI
jgi:glycosyltransferase involved in cell wall biosynthesis